MTADLLVELAWKSLIVGSVTLLVLGLMERRSAAEKSFIGHVGLLALLLLPIGVIGLPAVHLAAPPELAEAIAPASLATARPLSVSGFSPAAPGWAELAPWLHGIPASVLLLLTLVAVLRLGRLRSRAAVLVDAAWLTALAAAQQRLAFKQGTALLTSDEVVSPVSWGMFRPTIVLDPATAAAPAKAEAIVAHELAHVARLDWLKLLVGRAVVALLWFNPLVWMLAQRCHHIREEAADDVVLRSAVPNADYAELLVGSARHAHRGALLAANGVAPSSSSLSLRVSHVLDGGRSRAPARLGWVAAAFACALILNGALAAAEPVLRTQGLSAGAGDRAAEALARIEGAHTAALARALALGDWNARLPGGATLFDAPRSVPPLLDALRDDRPAVRRIALWGLSELRPGPGPEAHRPVSRLLADGDPAVRAQAARALGDFGAVEAAAAIAGLLLDGDPAVRRDAAHALGDLQSPAGRPGLRDALGDDDPAVRAKAAWALRQIDDAEAVIRRFDG